MLAILQKTKVAESVIKKMLKAGITPTASLIFEKIKEAMAGRLWGSPTATLRPAVYGAKIGGPDSRDIERTYQEIRDDLELFMEGSVSTADSLINRYAIFEAKKVLIKSRILRLIQSANGAADAFADGSDYLLQDTFNNNLLIDINKSTVELDVNAGYVTLSQSTRNLIPVDIGKIKIESEVYPTKAPHGKFTDALTPATNTGWYASLSGKTYKVRFSFLNKAGASAKTFNAIHIDPLSPVTVTVRYSADGYNFFDFSNAIDERIVQPKTWTFEEVNARGIEVTVTGTTAGIKTLQLLTVGYANQGLLYSKPLFTKDAFGNPVTVETVRLVADAELPAGTDIDYYVAPVFSDGSYGDWKEIKRSPILITGSSIVSTTLASTKVITGEGRNMFYTSIAAGANPVLSTGELTRGEGQWRVDYMEYKWEDDDGEESHTPSKDDWETFKFYKSGYFTPVAFSTDVNPITEGGSGMFTDTSTMLFESSQLYSYPEISEEVRKWFGIIVKKSGSRRLKPAGNYRFTTHVYMPEERILTDQAVVVINYGGSASGTVDVAPFAVYLNDEEIISYNKSVSGTISSEYALTDKASYSFKKGWNKLEVLVYVLDKEIGVGESIGILIEPNIYRLQAEDTSIRIQADPNKLKRVSEFQLRNVIAPVSKGHWAWTERITGKERIGVIFNYNPISTVDLDGYNRSEKPLLKLTYRNESASSAKGLMLKAELSKEPESPSIPKLHSYKLYVN